jgi:hypothetical protein
VSFADNIVLTLGTREDLFFAGFATLAAFA